MTSRGRTSRVAVALGAVLAASAASVAADGWTTRKCELYAAAWTRALEIRGAEGLGDGFIEDHDAFIASGCQGGTRVCPATEAEIGLANALTVLSMNDGMASTFVPFACPAVRPGRVGPESASPPG